VTQASVLVLLLEVAPIAWGQPPLPPQERPRAVATVIAASERDGLVLQGGKAAPLATGVQLRGVGSLAELAPGDLVELVQDENDLVQQITVLPRLAQRKRLAEVVAGSTQISFFWWRHEGTDFPDSIYAADATVPLQVPTLALEATVGCLLAPGEGPVTFAVLDAQGTLLWEAQVSPGETKPLRCPLGGTGTVALRCRGPDGNVPDHTQCIWGSPSLLLQEPGSIALHPDLASKLVDTLARELGNIDPGAIGVTQPRVTGLSQSMAIDLQHDLLVALGLRYKVAGLTPRPLSMDLAHYDPAAAGDLAADTVTASEIRYAPEGSAVRVALISADSREILAQAEATLQP
jgi:hypothetical protein